MIELRRVFLFVLLVVLPWAWGGGAARGESGEPEGKVDLFRAGEDGYFMYRIPGIAVTGRGSILVYCEARAGHGDWTRQDVLLRRSTDGGRTWSPPRKMAVAPPDLRPNPAAVAQGLGEHSELTAHNAVAIVDQQPGVVHFLYHVQYARVFYLRSEDDGESWTEPREITAVIEGFRDRYDWKVVGNGCGHSIQIRQGPHRGRLVVAVWLSTGTGGHAHRPSDVAVIYSDDGGRTWQRGDFIARNGDKTAAGEPIVNPSETMLVELPDGRVLANLRTESPRNRRLLSVSADGATGWSTPTFHEDLAEPVCMASMVRLADGRILFSNPDNLLVGGQPGQPGRNRDRRNVTLKLSDDDGGAWRPVQVVDPGPSGYSDLAVGPDGTVYCFYERGGIKGNHYHTEALTLAKFPADLLAENRTGTTRTVVAPSDDYPRNGEATWIVSDKGELLLFYGAHAGSGDWDRAVIRAVRSADGGRTWSEPVTQLADPQRSLFQPSLTRLANGELGLTHTVLAHGQDAYKVFRRSADEGRTWSDPLKISDDSHAYTTGPHNRLYTLSSGRLLALLHCNLAPKKDRQGGPLGAYVVYSDDHGRTWTRTPGDRVLHVADNPYRKHEWGFWEPSLVEHEPGKLLMMARTATGWLYECRSEDGGSTWTDPARSVVPNPLAPPALTQIPGTGTIVLLHNPRVEMESGWHGGPRTVLALRTSRDGGQSWSDPRPIAESGGENDWYDYPAVRWTDGTLHVAWRAIATRNRGQGGFRTVGIGTRTLTSAWIEQVSTVREITVQCPLAPRGRGQGEGAEPER